MKKKMKKRRKPRGPCKHKFESHCVGATCSKCGVKVYGS